MPDTRFLGILLLLLPLAVLLTGCEEPPPVEPIRPVLATKVGDVQGFQSNRFPGRAKAKEETNLSFRVFGPLVTRAVDVGDRVKAGDLIAQIDPTDYEVALENMEGRLDKAKADRQFAQSEYARVLRIKKDDPGTPAANPRAIAESASPTCPKNPDPGPICGPPGGLVLLNQ